MASAYNEWFENKRKRLKQEAERQKQEKLISSLSSDNILSEREAFFAKRRGNEAELRKKWEDLYKKALGYYNNEGYKTFADKYNGTINTEGYVNKRDTDKWYRELEELNKKDNEGIEELLAELDQYARYYNEDAVKYVRDLISEKQKAYSDAMEGAGKFRDHWAQWATEDDYNNSLWESDFASKLEAGDVAGASQMYQDKYSQNPPAEGDTKAAEYKDYINAARYNGWVDKYKNMSADELLAAKEQLSRDFTGNALKRDPMGNFNVSNAERGMELEYVDYLYQLALDNNKKKEYAAYDADAGQAEIDYLQGFAARANEIKTQLEQVAGEINRRKAKGQRTDDLESQKKKLLFDLYQVSEEYRGATTDTVLQNHNKLTGQNGGGLPDFSDLVDFDALLSQAEADHTTAMRYRDNSLMSLEPLDDPEFNSKSQYISAGQAEEPDLDPNNWFVKASGIYIGKENMMKLGYADPLHEYINGDETVKASIEDAYLLDAAAQGRDPLVEDTLGKYAEMTDDQIALYNYYYNTEGADAAKRYLKSIDEELKKRKGFSNYEKYFKDQPAILQALYSIPVGLDQFKSGITGIFADGYTPASPTQITGQLVREDLKDDSIPLWYNFKEGEWEDEVFGSSLGQIGYDLGSTTANMLPSILASVAVNAVAPGAGAVVGAGLMGASAGGNAKVEMLNLGYSKEQAEAYGLLVGAAEGGMEYLLGGISSLGGKLPKRALKKFLTKIDNALARVAINVGREMLSEGFEEGLQTVIEPWLKEAATNVDWESPTVDEVLYSSLLGALSSVGMNVPDIAVDTGSAMREKSNAIKAEGSKFTSDPEALINEALAHDPNNKLALSLKAKLESGKPISEMELGKLSIKDTKTVDKTYSRELNTAKKELGDIAKKEAKNNAQREVEAKQALQEKIEDKLANRIERNDANQKKISSLAETVVKAAYGESVTNAELRKLSQSEAGIRALNNEFNLTEKDTKLKVGDSVSRIRQAISSRQSTQTKLSSDNILATYAAHFNMDEVAERSLIDNYALDAQNARSGKNLTPESYASAYGVVYAAAKRGADLNKATKLMEEARNTLSERSFVQAVMAGRIEAISSQKDLQNGENSDTIIKNAQEVQNEQGVYLRDSGERNRGQNTQGQIPGMEGYARPNQSRREGRTGPRDSEAASLTYDREVDAEELGISGGHKSGKVYLYAEGSETASMKEAKRIAAERGLNVKFFGGGNLKIEIDDKKVNARAYIQGNDVYIRADHADFTAYQLMKHEAAHDMINKGEINVADVKKLINERFTPEEIDAVINSYALAYEKAGMTADEIWEEIICDSVADMNVFEGRKDYEAAAEMAADFLPDLREATLESKKESRGPQKAQEGKASREYWYPDLNDREWSLLNRTMNRQISTSQNYIDEATKWLYADEKGVKVFAIYGIGDGTEPTVLFAVGGAKAQTLNQRRIEYETNIKRSAGNAYKKNLDRLGIQQNQYGNSVNNDRQNEHAAIAGVGQVSNGSRRGHNGGTTSENSEIKGKASIDLESMDSEYMSAVERGDMETAQKMVDKAAKKNGFTPEHLFHGTSAFGFTKTDVTNSDDGISFFVTNKEEVAQGYFPYYENEYDDYHDSVRRIGKKSERPRTPLSQTSSIESVIKSIKKTDLDYKNARVATHADVLADLENWWLPNAVSSARELQNYSVPSNVRELVDLVVNASADGSYEAWNAVADRYSEFEGIYDIMYNGQYWNQATSLWHKVQMGIQMASKIMGKDAIVNNGKVESKAVLVNKYNDYLAGEANGIYDLYANHSNQLVIRGNGSNWNNIPLGNIAGQFNEWWVNEKGHEPSENGGYTRGNTRNIAEFAKAKGYRSVCFVDIYDSGVYGSRGDLSTVYAFFNPREDIKSADPVTYDDNGKVIPLSERFNSEDADIRFSYDLESMDEDFDAVDTESDIAERELSPREMLASMLESDDMSPSQKGMLTKYKNKLSDIEANEAEISKMTDQLDELKKNGKGNTSRAAVLENKIRTLEKQNAVSEGIILNLEATKHIKRLLERERKAAYQEGLLAGQMAQGKDDAPKLRRAEAKLEAQRQSAKDKLADQRQKSRDKLSEQKQTANEKISTLQKEKREAYKEGVLAGQMAQGRRDAEILRHANERIEANARAYLESRAKSVEGRRRTKLKEDIRNVVQTLDTLLRKGNKKSNVKIGLKDAVAAALEAFDINAEKVERYNKDMARLDAKIKAATDPMEIEALKALREKKQRNSELLSDKLAAMKKAYEDIHNNEDGENYPSYYRAEAKTIMDRISDVLTKVGDTPISEMTSDQLKAVYDMYRMVLTTVRDANKAFIDGKLVDLTENAAAMESDLKKIKKLPEERLKAGDSARGFVWNELTPYYAFKRIGSETLMRYYDELVRGQDVYARDLDEAKSFAENLRKRYKADSWNRNKVVSFKDKDGKSFKLNLGQMMSIYAYSKRDQALDHMEKGGFFFNNKETFRTKGGIVEFISSNETGYKIDAAALSRIKSALTADQITYVDKMQAYLTDMGAKGNEVSRQMWGIDIFNEKVYFPLKSKEDFIYSANTPAETSSLKNDGMTKETKPHASNPIVLESFDEVWANHVNKMSMYHGFVIPIDNLNKLINYGSWIDGDAQSISTMLEARYSSAVNDYLTTFIKDLNGAKAQNGGLLGVMSNWLTKFKKTAVAASLSVVVQQPTAILRATSEIDAKYFTHLPKAETLNKKWEKIKKYAPIATIKDIGGFDAGSGRQITEWLNADTQQGVKKATNKLDDLTMYGAALGDRLGWGAIWSAVEREVQVKQKLKYGTEEFWQACGKRFTEVIVKTQVYDSTLSRSGFMRGKDGLLKMATAFMGEPTLSINMLADAILQGKRGTMKKQQVARTVAAVYTATVAASVIKSLIYALRDDDEDESYVEKYMQALGSNILIDALTINMIPILRDVISIFTGWEVERADMALVQDLYNSIMSLDSEEKSVYRKIEDFGGALSAFAGIPGKNLLRTGREIYNAINDAFDGIKGGDVGGAFVEGVTGKEKSKAQTLYEALIGGEKERIAAIRKGYKTDEDYKTAVRTALRKYDPRIKKAAQALYEGDLLTRNEIMLDILGEGVFDKTTVDKAIDAEMQAIKKAENEGNDSQETEPTDGGSIYSANDINLAFDYNTEDLALEIIKELTEIKVTEKVDAARDKAEAKGESFDEDEAREEAEYEVASSLRSTMTKYWKPKYQQAYEANDTTEMYRIEDILYASGLYEYKSSKTLDDVLDEWLYSDEE